MVKIIDKIKALDEEQTFFSYEYFPPKTDAGVLNLFDRIDRMARTEPLFCDCTWGAGGSTSDLTLEICTTVQKFFGLDIMMHLTCTNMSVSLLYDALKQAKEAGIQNILALRGDPPVGKEWTKTEDGFANAVDLVVSPGSSDGEPLSVAFASDADAQFREVAECYQPPRGPTPV